MHPVLLFAVIFRFVEAFNFTIAGTPTQCDDLEINWTGGQPPFRILMFPPGGTMRNISIPSSASINAEGSFKVQVPFARGRRLLLSMSDATGPVAGGTSDMLVVGQSISGANCNTTDPNVDFFFSLDSDLVQCRPYPFTRYPNAIQPVTIIVSIPMGESFVLNPPIGQSYNWTATAEAGTSMVFSMFDSKGRNGGTSDVKIVIRTNDTTCFGGVPPAAVTTVSVSGPAKISSGAIAGIVVGVLLFLASVPAAAILCIQRERQKAAEMTSVHHYPIIDLTSERVDQPVAAVASNDSTEHYQPRPYLLPPPQTTISSCSVDRRLSKISTQDPGSVVGGPSRSSTRRSHVIVHSDIEEVMPESEGDVMELPPLYADRRSPVVTRAFLDPSSILQPHQKKNG